MKASSNVMPLRWPPLLIKGRFTEGGNGVSCLPRPPTKILALDVSAVEVI